MKKIVLLLIFVIFSLGVCFASITKEEAINIAFKKAEVTKNDITELKIKLDRGKRVDCWEVEFFVSNTNCEWEFEIYSDNGDIKKYSCEIYRDIVE